MLQGASDWWYGSADTKTDEPDDEQHSGQTSNQTETENADTETDEKKEEAFSISFKPELDSISCLDPVICMFKLVDFKSAITSMLAKQFESPKLTAKEHQGLLALFDKILATGLPSRPYLLLYERMKVGEVILSYFASLSPTNPDAFGCWHRWVVYLLDATMTAKLAPDAVSDSKLAAFYATQGSQVGFDRQGRFIWFVSTKHYDGDIDDDTQRKAVVLMLLSFFWDWKRDAMDLGVLRSGIRSHLDLSAWAVNLISWSTVTAIKDAMVCQGSESSLVKVLQKTSH